MSELQQLFVDQGHAMRVLANTVISIRGERQTRLWQVRTGQVLLYATSFRGREIGIAIVKPGGIFGFTSLFHDMKAIVTAVTLTDSELLTLDQLTSEQAIKNNSNLTIELLKICVSALADRVRQIEELAASKLPNRLARWILEQFREQQIKIIPGATIEIEASQRLVAIMAGASRETINRQVRKWEQAGVIEWKGKILRILDPQGLEQNANPSSK